jgi:hypothetical protein
MKNKIKILLLIVTLGFLASGCDLNVSNPNSPTNEDLKTYDGMRMTAIGMQRRLSQSIGDFNTVSGAVSGETSPIIAYVGYQALRKYPDATKRSPLDKSNEYMVTVWSVQFQIVKSANDILNNIGSISMDQKLKNNIIAFAEVGKVMAFYNLITHWEKIPIDINKDHPSFVNRAAVVTECLSLLSDAEAKVSSGLATEFTNNVIGKSWDLPNTIQAYKARVLLMKGDYANAIAAASNVTTESAYVYDQSNGTNPLWVNYVSSKFSAALGSWVEGAEKGDTRVAATVDLTTKKSDYFGKDTAYIITKYNTATVPYEIYTLNEMSLIKAEAYARNGNSGSALTEVNKVRLAAGLQGYSGSNILKEIFIQRFYECYLMAQHFEDLRRFKSDNIDVVNYQRSAQLAHEWLIYPYTEIDVNPNCPPQPLNINLGM